VSLPPYDNISARLEDNDFAQRAVQGFESFAAGDQLRVLLRVESWEKKDSMKYRFFIPTVLERREARAGEV
jgi:ribosomal protein L19